MLSYTTARGISDVQNLSGFKTVNDIRVMLTKIVCLVLPE